MKNLTILLGALLAVACGGGSGERGTAEPGDPCENTIDCTPGSICYSLVCVGEGPVRFSMSWTAETDIDLHVMTPAGNEIYYGDREYDAGTLDVDDCIGGGCATPGAEHVENVFFTDVAMHGVYEFWAVNYDATVDTEVTIEGFLDGSPMTFTETIPMLDPAEGVHHMLTY